MDFSNTFLKKYIHSLFYLVFLFTSNLCLKYENVYVINLNSRPDRLAFMTEILNEIQQAFIRMEAIDGKALEELCENKMPLPLNPHISYTCEDLIRNKSENKCKIGEIGAWLSHLQAYFQIVENYERTGRDNPTLILEDDIDMDVNFKELVNESFSHLPSDWEVFYAGCTEPKGIKKLPNNIATSRYFWGAHAYIVRNVEVAKKMIAISNNKDCKVADLLFIPAIKNKELFGYIAHPQQYVSYVIKFGTDIQPTIKDVSFRVQKLKESTLEKIEKRNREILDF